MKKAPPPSARPPLPRISEEMKQWCALLEGEMETWPQVRSRPMFGMRAFYRGRRIFACIPRTRALGAANAIILKFSDAREVLRRAGGELSPLDPGAAVPRSTPSPATAGARRGPRSPPIAPKAGATGAPLGGSRDQRTAGPAAGAGMA